MAVTDYRHLSLWHDSFPGVVQRRAPLPGNREVDVCIVGAGFTGLWTAYYLTRTDPSLRIAVLEQETAGYGASGRNGGWCSALFPVSMAALLDRDRRGGGSGGRRGAHRLRVPQRRHDRARA
jgi:choline dehydrogenase-like flavoprotein